MATNSVTTDTTNYTRIYLLLVRGGTLLTKTLFIKRANDLSPPGPPGLQQQQKVDQFLRDNTRRRAILSTTTGKNYKEKIYPQTGTTNLEEFDLYLFCFILITVCNLPQTNKDDIETLKETRNDLSHCHSPTLCERYFYYLLTQIKEVFERTLQYINDQSFTDEITLLINKYEQGPLSIDEIVTFYHEVNRMYSTIHDKMTLLEKQAYMIQNMLQNHHAMLQNHHAMLQNVMMMLQNVNIQSAKQDDVLAKVTNIESRLLSGTSIDIQGAVFGIPPTPTQENKHEMNTRNLQTEPEASPKFNMSSSSPGLQRRQTTVDVSTPVPNENTTGEQKYGEAANEAYLSASLLDSTAFFDPDYASLNYGCIECAKVVPVFSADEIEEGDHIVFAGAVYDHHAIVVGKVSDGATFRIVEATNTLSGVTVGLFLGRKARITSSNRTFDFSKQKIWVIVYRQRLYSKSQVSERAKRFAEGTDDEYKYDLLDNNCEHFATYCVTGIQFSIQVTKFRLTARLFITSRFVGMSDEQKRNEKEFENKIICEQCYEMNKKLLSVTVIPIKAAEDVQVGDIIRYSYYYLWHEAVVLEITDIQSKFVQCHIAHYAFCGLFSYRTIIEEEYKINFNGQCSKLEYGSPDYHVYDPVTVVERAKSRLGEQQFVFFSNDSSHYARWCKLKLEKQ